jgi:hypothetical protein
VEVPITFRPEDLSEKWAVVVGSAQARELEQELDRELIPGHVLHGLRAEAIAVRQLRKETIWWLPDDAAWALVHLTWTTESDPRWPTAVILPTWGNVVAELAEWGRA